jgi:D-alanine-D-alanine ligase
MRYPLFAKPIAEGTGKGVTPQSRVFRRSELMKACERLLEKFRQPVLLEEFLPGREFTVGLHGTGAEAEVLGTLEILLRPEAEADVYSYANKERSEERVDYRVGRPEEDGEIRRAEEIALAAWRALGCRDGGRVDLRSDSQGRPQFLEANPLAGLHPTHSDLPMLATAQGMSYVDLIGRIIESAEERLPRNESHSVS